MDGVEGGGHLATRILLYYPVWLRFARGTAIPQNEVTKPEIVEGQGDAN